jgi:hypothetical protein
LAVVTYDTSKSPGNKHLMAGTMNAGYFGTVSASEFITGDALASNVGLSIGGSQFSDIDWLKFAHKGKVQFVPMKPFRFNLHWGHINSANLVYGDKTIEINGLTYKVRLMRGSADDPYMGVTDGSEWNNLMMQVHEQGNWEIGFTDEDLCTDENIFFYGSATICQEVQSNADYRVYRGGEGVSYLGTVGATSANPEYGWRPVLEIEEMPPGIEISVPEGHLGEFTNGDNLLTYAITGDDLTTITEKVNGVVVDTKEAVSGQELSVSLTEARWGAIRFGKYADATGGKNTLTIEMGDQKWTYTFDKRLATDADILSAVKAAKDVSETITPYYLGNQTIDFYIEDTEPVPNKVGDVWVKMNEILMQNNVILSEIQPTSAQDKQLWQTVSGLDYTLSLEKMSAFFDRNEEELHIEIDSKSLLSSIPQDKILLWQNMYSKAFGDLSDVHYWNLATNEWTKVEAFMWNGSTWVQISSLGLKVYDYGVEHINIVPSYSNTSVNRYTEEENRILLNKAGGLYRLGLITDTLVNVGNYDTLKIEWEKTVEGPSGSHVAVIGLNTTKNNTNKDTDLVSTTMTYSFEKQVSTVDISNISGEAYIEVINTQLYSGSDYSHLYVYKIWLE